MVSDTEGVFPPYDLFKPICVAELSKVRVCVRSLAGKAGLNPAGSVVFFKCYMWSGRSPSDLPIPLPEESCRLWCVTECGQVEHYPSTSALGKVKVLLKN